jgi:hypothetical protein
MRRGRPGGRGPASRRTQALAAGHSAGARDEPQPLPAKANSAVSRPACAGPTPSSPACWARSAALRVPAHARLGASALPARLPRRAVVAIVVASTGLARLLPADRGLQDLRVWVGQVTGDDAGVPGGKHVGRELGGLRATAVTSWWASRAWARSCRPTPPVEAMIVSSISALQVIIAGQFWRVSMTTGICRVVLAWNSPRAGVSATSFGHSSARAARPSSCANTVNVWVPTSTVILGWALRL